MSQLARLALVTVFVLYSSHGITAAKQYEWDKFGYSSYLWRFLLTGDSAFHVASVFSEPKQVCEAISTSVGIISGDPPIPLQVCSNGPQNTSFCIDVRSKCLFDGEAVNHPSYDITPVCSRNPLPIDQSRARVGAAGRPEFNYASGKCNCIRSDKPDKTLWPDHDTIYCYAPPRLLVSPEEIRYDRKAPSKTIRVQAYVERDVNTTLKNPDVKVSIKTTSGEPGKLSTPVLGADGVISFDYTFPSFTNAKTDTVVVTCDSCAAGADTVLLNIPMAPTLVGFFNGVWNTRRQADNGLGKLKQETDAVKGTQNISYDLFYNQTGTGQASDSKVGSALQDLAEVFDQRSQELDGVLASRWETFWDITGARHASRSSGIGDLLQQLGGAAVELAKLVDSIFNATLAKIVAGYAGMLSNPPTAADLSAHNAKLQQYAEEGHPIVLIAHSQGNLFVNRAFDTLRAAKPDTPAKVIHIAPASPTLRGDYVLSSNDLVINGLRIQGVTSVPLSNLTVEPSTIDISGHKLTETYLDANRSALDRFKSMIKSAIDGI